MHFSFGPFEMYQKSRMTIMAVRGDCSGRLAFLLHQLPRKRQVMLQYAGVYASTARRVTHHAAHAVMTGGIT